MGRLNLHLLYMGLMDGGCLEKGCIFISVSVSGFFFALVYNINCGIWNKIKEENKKISKVKICGS